MLAYSTYADIQGGTNDAFGKFLTAADGVNVDRKYDLSNIDTNYLIVLMMLNLL